MIKIRPDKNWLHYVPVVGYDGQNIFVAESLAELSNCNEPHYNRRIPVKEFKKLWNTAMPKMPLYANTFLGWKDKKVRENVTVNNKNITLNGKNITVKLTQM